MEDIIKIMMKLRESPKLDPEQDISHLVPRIYGVYGWFNKKDDIIEYILGVRLVRVVYIREL